MPLNHTILDVLKFKGLNGRDVINEVIASNPAYTGNDAIGNSIPVSYDTVPTETFDALYRIDNPDIDPFRKINAGAGSSKGNYETRRYHIDTVTRYFWIDQALTRRNAEAGARLLEAECANGVEAVQNGLERQFFYGGQKANSNASTLGFQGLQTLIDKDMMFNAGGTGSALASAYLVNFNTRNGVTWLFGNQGETEFGQPVEDDIPDPKDPTKMIPVLKTKFEFYPGLAFLSRFAASRIANIDTATAYTVAKNREAFTDEHIATAISRWPYGTPNAILMPKAAGLMLAASRTVSRVVGVGGGGGDVMVQAGFVSLPKDHDGIPIAYSNAQIIGEKLVPNTAFPD